MNIRLGRVMTVGVAAACVAWGAGAARAEIRFGECSYGHREHSREVAQYGRFFATTDYGDLGRDWNAYLRGRAIEKPGVSPGYGKPWTSDGNRTLFGVTFNYPLGKPGYGQVDYSNTIPLVDRAIIWWGGGWWGGDVPAPGSWNACILSTDDTLVKVDPDNTKTLFPGDRTTLDFPPTTLKAFYVGLKGREDGITNYATVRGIKLLAVADRNLSLTNNMYVSMPDLYQATFSSLSPGMIDSLLPVTPFFAEGQPLSLFYAMTPFLTYNGTNVFAVRKDCPVTVTRSNTADIAAYTLTFDVPGHPPVDLRVRSIFRESADKSLEFSFRSGPMPAGVRIGYRVYGPDSVFGALADASPALSGEAIPLRTSAGRMTVFLKGSDHIDLARADAGPGMPRRIPGFEGAKWVKLETLASGPELEVAVSLPLGPAGRPPPESLAYTWRPSRAADGEEGIAPFKGSDLELLEDIDCGNPDDPHAFYDCTHDPALDALIKKYGKDPLRPRAQELWGYLGFLFADDPRQFAVPLETIGGQRCRVIPAEMGSYFRYDLNTRLKPRIPYLVVVEHAFDQVRRSAFYSIAFDEKTGDLVASRGLMGGFEAEVSTNGGFRTESVLCCFQGLSYPEFRGIAARNAIVFANKMHSGPWIKAPGLAVRRIRLYRVKSMPSLPELAARLPPGTQQRSVTVWTEMDRGKDAWYLFQYPQLVGYSALMTHAMQGSALFGHTSWHGMPTGPQGWNHVGTLAGNELAFAAAQEQGISINIHLGELLHLGFEGTDYHSFIQPWDCKGETIPFQPTREELDHIAGALRNVMPKLAPYRSLRDVSMYFLPGTTLTRRNLDDFCKATGVRLTPAPLGVENIQSLLNGGPEVIRQWQQWACAERFKVNQWLLAELRQYRPDVFITLLRSWDHGLLQYLTSFDSLPGADRRTLAAAGLKTYVDLLRFMGLDPDLYAGNPGFSFELEASPRLRAGKEVPDYYDTDWFRHLRNAFRTGGLGMMVHCATLEATVPFQFYHCPFVAPREHYRRELIRALVFANPRNITLGAYNWPWEARLADFREFAVPYRLLPFAEPEEYGGKLTDTASQAVIKRYGDRHGLVNAGDRDTVVDLELPAGSTAVSDLSGGVPEKLEPVKTKGGKLAVKIAMPPWSLRTLEIK